MPATIGSERNPQGWEKDVGGVAPSVADKFLMQKAVVIRIESETQCFAFIRQSGQDSYSHVFCVFSHK